MWRVRVAFAAALSGPFQFGIAVVIINTMLNTLTSDLGFDKNVGGGVAAAAVFLGACVGGFVAGPFDDVAGKYAQIWIAFFYALGDLLCAFATGHKVCWGGAFDGCVASMILFGRLVTGLASGLVLVVSPRFLTEISPPEIRGAIGASFQLAVAAGVCFGLMMGLPLESDSFDIGYDWWRVMFLIAAIPAIIQGFLMPLTFPLYRISRAELRMSISSKKFVEMAQSSKRGRSLKTTSTPAALTPNMDRDSISTAGDVNNRIEESSPQEREYHTVAIPVTVEPSSSTSTDPEIQIATDHKDKAQELTENVRSLPDIENGTRASANPCRAENVSKTVSIELPKRTGTLSGLSQSARMDRRADASAASDEERLSLKQQWAKSLRLVTQKRYRRSVILGIGVPVVGRLCGIDIFTAYTTTVFEDVGFEQPIIGSSIFGAAILVVTIVSVFLFDSVGRVNLARISFLGMAVGHLVLGLSGFAHESVAGPLAVAAAVIFIASFAIGAGSLNKTYAPEVVPPEVAGIVIGTGQSVATLSSLSLVVVFPTLLDTLGVKLYFCLHCCFVLLSLLFLQTYMIETKGRDLDSIMAEMRQERGNRKQKSNDKNDKNDDVVKE